ncbi:MAG: S-adenosylmethionine decarboxylase [Nitrososphaerota archaeon]|nr:S-adenosylmethionine decarboxylase [Candidatus Bathyarchaeota archaeon]MDW8062096.1 S-adenosylmethionine decarboxylase [Nitrososphaerota archaeon]
MKNLKPEIFRKRVIIEGFYDVEMNEGFVRSFLVDLSRTLGMDIIVGPIVFSPDRYSKLHHGVGGYLAWVGSGVSIYTWRDHKFFTLDVYSCIDLGTAKLVSYVSSKLRCSEIVWCEVSYES